MGMPTGKKENPFGDLYAKVKITIPKNLSEEETELINKLKDLRNKK